MEWIIGGIAAIYVIRLIFSNNDSSSGSNEQRMNTGSSSRSNNRKTKYNLPKAE